MLKTPVNQQYGPDGNVLQKYFTISKKKIDKVNYANIYFSIYSSISNLYYHYTFTYKTVKNLTYNALNKMRIDLNA